MQWAIYVVFGFLRVHVCMFVCAILCLLTRVHRSSGTNCCVVGALLLSWQKWYTVSFFVYRAFGVPILRGCSHNFHNPSQGSLKDAMKIANQLMSVISAMCVPSALSYYIDLLVQLKSPWWYVEKYYTFRKREKCGKTCATCVFLHKEANKSTVTLITWPWLVDWYS